MSQITQLLKAICDAEEKGKKNINLTPSENTLSPLARLPFILDSHARYFLDDLRIFGKWCFPSGKSLGEIEQNILIPLLQELTGAKYINVRPISGMNCMTIALAGLSQPGDSIFVIPVNKGGHPSTLNIAERFALQVHYIPFENDYDIDYVMLEAALFKAKPAMIYIDQATFLFPIDTTKIRNLLDSVSPKTVIHFDSSHTNGLILGKAIANPLDQGSHCFGGSTHKTLPGPHKGFLATNDHDVYLKIQKASDSFVSHHHMSGVLSLAITLMELKLCDGNKYASRVIDNAKLLARGLSDGGFYVAGKERDYTECHQILAYPKTSEEAMSSQVNNLLNKGILINNFNGLPGINRPAYRLSTAEITRMGAGKEEIKLLTEVMLDSQDYNNHNFAAIDEKISFLKYKLSKPKFCFSYEDIKDKIVSDSIQEISSALFEYV